MISYEFIYKLTQFNIKFTKSIYFIQEYIKTYDIIYLNWVMILYISIESHTHNLVYEQVIMSNIDSSNDEA